VNKKKIIQRLRKIRRFDLTHKMRADDTTIAYYSKEEDLMIIFIDIALDDMMTHWRIWGRLRETTIDRFVAKYLTKVTLHELFHWGGIKSSKICEFLSIMCVWNDEIANIIASWMYPEEIRTETNFIKGVQPDA